jgi:hypothetical protein
MARNLKDKHVVKAYGPGGGVILSCSFSLVTTALTAIEEQGCTVSRTAAGTYVIALGSTYKAVNVALGTIAASTAQLFIVTAVDLAARTITIKQVTAGGGTAVDTLTARVDVQIFARTVS